MPTGTNLKNPYCCRCEDVFQYLYRDCFEWVNVFWTFSHTDVCTNTTVNTFIIRWQRRQCSIKYQYQALSWNIYTFWNETMYSARNTTYNASSDKHHCPIYQWEYVHSLIMRLQQSFLEIIIWTVRYKLSVLGVTFNCFWKEWK